MPSLKITPQVPNNIQLGRLDESISESNKSQFVVANANLKSELRPDSDGGLLARFPWDPNVVTASPAGRNIKQIKKDFVGEMEDSIWGTVVAQPSTRNFNMFTPSLRDAHGSLPLPNTKDDIPTVFQVDDAGRKADTSVKHLRDLKGIAIRAATAGHLIMPEATRGMRHYLVATGKPLERVVGRSFWNTDKGTAAGPNIEKYLRELEKSALRYAIDNPKATEFTIQGPLFKLLHQDNYDLRSAIGSFHAGGRAHYKINRSPDGKITLDGLNQMFGVYYYNFEHGGKAMPALPGEKVSQVDQGYLQAMSLVKYNGEYLAKPFEQTFLEQPSKSYITNKP